MVAVHGSLGFLGLVKGDPILAAFSCWSFAGHSLRGHGWCGFSGLWT